MFVVTTLIALFLGLSIWLGKPLLFPVAAILLAAYCAWEGTRANRAGIVLAALGAELLTVFGYGAYVAPDNLGFYIVAFLALLSTGLLTVGGTLFLVSAYNQKSARWQNAFCCVASCFVPAAWFVVVLPMAKNALDARIARRNADNAAVMSKIVADANAACARLGRAPKDEGELIKVLGKPMPKINVGYSLGPIHYAYIGPGHFQLSFINANWNISLYDSQTPKRGWYEVPF